MEAQGFLIFIGIIVISFNIFVIYFIFKVLQFVIQAINIYKKMIIRQDATINLLIDIRDNTKTFDNQSFEEAEKEIGSEPQVELKTCENCNTEIPAMYKRCPKCGNKFE